MSSLAGGLPTEFTVSSVFFCGNVHQISYFNQHALMYALFHSDSIIRRTNQMLLQASDTALPDRFGTNEILPCPTPELTVRHDYLALLYRQTFGTLHVCGENDFQAAVRSCRAANPERLSAIAAQEMEAVAEEICLSDKANGVPSDVVCLKNMCDTAPDKENCRLMMRQMPASILTAMSGMIGVPEQELSEDDYLDVFFSHLIKMQELAIDYYRRLAGFTVVLPGPYPSAAATIPMTVLPLSSQAYKNMDAARQYDVFLGCLATANTADLLKILPDIYTLLPAQETVRRNLPHAPTLDKVVAQLVKVDEMAMTGINIQNGLHGIIGTPINRYSPNDLLTVLIHVLNLYPDLCELILGNLPSLELQQQFFAFLNIATLRVREEEMAG